MSIRALTGVVLTLLLLTAHAQSDEYAAVRERLATCVTCHGENGAAPIEPQFPILAGQEQYYLYVQLKDFKSGLRAGPVMGAIAAPLEKAEMQLLAKFFSEQTWPRLGLKYSAEARTRAQAMASAGQCTQCHLGGFVGNSRIPRLAGQQPEYLLKTMRDFRSRARNNAPDIAALMEVFSDEDLAAMAEYLAGL